MSSGNISSHLWGILKHMICLVVEPYLSEKYEFVSSSVGMMKFPTEWKNHPNVPKHQLYRTDPKLLSTVL